MKLLRTTAVGAMLAVALAVSGAASVLAWNASCNSGEACVWKNASMGNPLAAQASTDANYAGNVYPGTSQDLDELASSIRNVKSGNDVVWFFNKNFGGISYCLNAGWEAASLGSHNDRYSSHQVFSNSTC